MTSHCHSDLYIRGAYGKGEAVLPTLMKWLAFLLVAVIGVAAYLAHVQSLKDAEEKAELLAASQIAQERAVRLEQESKAEEQRRQRPPMAIALAVEPLWLQLQAPLSLKEPVDLVPLVQATRQHILEKRVQVEPARGVVFDRATALLNYLAALADERTKALKTMIRNRNSSSTLNRSDAGNFFGQGVSTRWDETVVRARPAVNQLLEQLRAAEREWNQQARPHGIPEDYDLASLTPVLIPVDPPESGSSLGPRGGQRRMPGQ